MRMRPKLPQAAPDSAAGDFVRAVAAHDRVLASCGARVPGGPGEGRRWAEFWVRAPLDARPASVGNGSHAAFLEFVRSAVADFHRDALAAGESGGRADAAMR